jgi:putative transposase
MNTHYHLVIETTRIALSSGMKRLNGLYAQGFNDRHGRTGHLFGDRFWASLVESEEYLEAACLYVASNPVRAELCDEAGRLALEPKSLRARALADGGPEDEREDDD